MPTREKRKKLVKEVDVQQAVSYEDVIQLIGSESDPCFGKHHDPTNKHCQGCGDSEICNIVMSQRMHIKRGKLEAKSGFMDVKADDEVPLLKPSQLHSFILPKVKKPKPLSTIIKWVKAEFDPNELLDNKEIKKAVKSMITNKRSKLVVKSKSGKKFVIRKTTKKG